MKTNRTYFLKSLGASGLVLLSNGLINKEAVKIHDNYIQGLLHYDFKQIKDSMQEGDEVQLVREPTNVYDSFAV